MPDLVKFVLVILVIWVIYQLVTSVLFSLSQKAVKKRLKSNKMTDQQLVNLYHSVAKSNQYFLMEFFTKVMKNKVMKCTSCIEMKWKKETCYKRNFKVTYFSDK